MKITAYKDPVSGKIFPSSRQLNAFVKKRNDEEAERQRVLQAAVEKWKNDDNFVQNLLTPSAATAAIKERYEAAIRARKPKKNAPPLLVEKVVVDEWRIEKLGSGHLGLSFQYRVEFSEPVNKALVKFDDWYSGMEAHLTLPSADQLEKFKQNDDRAYGARVHYKLERIPNLVQKLKEIADLDKKGKKHAEAVKEKAVAASKADTEYTEARAALLRAQELLTAAQKAVSTRGEELLQKALEETPFLEETRLKELFDSLEVETSADLLMPSTLQLVADSKL